MAKEKTPMTAALRALEAAGVEYRPRLYKYVDKGGTAEAARQLGLDEHLVIKTLVFEDEAGSPFLVLMHGDRQVSAKNLARSLGVKSASPCRPEAAHRHTGYLVGGISPFGARKKMPVYVEETILDLPRIIINGGRRGLLVEIQPRDLVRVLEARPVAAAL
ncbi:MAG: Cys-tRNA(Pro) deacylase [Thermodesulfobacteriota bacterium]